MDNQKITNDMIFAKTLAYALTSSLDTYRQNRLLNLNLNVKKLKNGIIYAAGGGFAISASCHKVIEFCENKHMNSFLSVALGVLFANIIKTPIVYNYKRVQIGLQPLLTFPKENFNNILKINVIEDIIEETAKYTLSKYRLKSKNDKNVFVDSLMLFSLSYPFDVIKNANVYNKCIKGDPCDFAFRFLQKNVQNMIYLKTLFLLQK